jgi:hypothetical protein
MEYKMSEQHEIDEIEVTIEVLKGAVENRNRLHRLLENKDFQGLILEGYIKSESVRLTKTLGDSSIRANTRAFDSTIDELKAIGLLDNHLRALELLGNQAEDSLTGYENMQLEEESGE